MRAGTAADRRTGRSGSVRRNGIEYHSDKTEERQRQGSRSMEAALAEVEKYYSPNRLNRLLLLTDGQTYGSRTGQRRPTAGRPERTP